MPKRAATEITPEPTPAKGKDKQMAVEPAEPAEPVAEQPVNQAVAKTRSLFSKPVQSAVVVRGGGSNRSTALSKMTGIVVSVEDKMRKGRQGQSIPMVQLRIACDAFITNGSIDSLSTSAVGEARLFPSKRIDDPSSAEDTSNSNGYASKVRILHLDEDLETQSTFKPGMLLTSFFRTEKVDDKEVPSVASQAVVGLRCEVEGLRADAKDDGGIFLNADRIRADLTTAPPPHKVAQNFIEFCTQPSMQKQAAFNISRVFSGHFAPCDGDDAIHVEQKMHCQNMWRAHVGETADRLEAMAQGKPTETHDAMMAKAKSVREVDVSKIASGEKTIWTNSQYDKDHAPMAHYGWAPWTEEHPLQKKISDKDFSGLNSTFIIPKVCKITDKPKVVHVHFVVATLFNLPAAREAVLKGADETPFIMMPQEAAVVEVSKKDLAAKMGTFAESKVALVTQEILPFGDFAMFTRIQNEPGSFGPVVVANWPDGFFVDMCTTLAKTSLVVSHEFIAKHLGGVDQVTKPEDLDKACYQYTEDLPELEQLDVKVKRARLKTAYFMELSTITWTMKGLKAEMPPGTTVEMRVVYEGVTKDLAVHKDMATDAAKAEKHLEVIVGLLSAESAAPMTDFLVKSCAVYAVAVPVPAPVDADMGGPASEAPTAWRRRRAATGGDGRARADLVPTWCREEPDSARTETPRQE